MYKIYIIGPEEDLEVQAGNMNGINISREDVMSIARNQGVKEVCSYSITCTDEDAKAKRVYTLVIEGIDCALKRKKLFFTLTEWEELVDGNNQTQE